MEMRKNSENPSDEIHDKTEPKITQSKMMKLISTFLSTNASKKYKIYALFIRMGMKKTCLVFGPNARR